jgi:hypothetical protein
MISRRDRMFRPYIRMEGVSFVVPYGVIRYLQRNEFSFLLMQLESPNADSVAFLND